LPIFVFILATSVAMHQVVDTGGLDVLIYLIYYLFYAAECRQLESRL